MLIINNMSLHDILSDTFCFNKTEETISYYNVKRTSIYYVLQLQKKFQFLMNWFYKQEKISTL